MDLLNAVSDNNYDRILDLIISGYDVNYKDKDGRTSLSIAIEHDYKQIILLLLDLMTT
jgi:ankyrin repeat protein